MFLISASKSILKVEETELLVSGAQNIYDCHFVFSPEWDGLVPTVVFRSDAAKISVLPDLEGWCRIPYEVLTAPCNSLQAGIYGTKDGVLVMPTIWADLGKIQPGAVPGEVGQEPPEDVYSQVLEQMRQTKEIAQSVRDDADNGLFQGKQGAEGKAGAPAQLVSQTTQWQVGNSGTVHPEGQWSHAVPVVPQGSYLWSRTTLVFNSGEPVVNYTVTRMGRDGTGSVCSVNDKAPDGNGNVMLTATDIGARPENWMPTAADVGARPKNWMPAAAETGALPSSGGSMSGPINMQGQTITGLNDPVNDTDAVRKGYVDSLCPFPVGYIYLSMEETSPASLYANTVWERIKDVFLLAAGDRYETGSTGGAETVSLTQAQNGPHNHSLETIGTAGNYQLQVGRDGAYTGSNFASLGTSVSAFSESTVRISDSGEGAPHENMPPYLTVNVWKRIA